MNRKTFLVQEAPHLIVAEAYARHLFQVRGQPRGRPVRKAVSQPHRIGQDRFFHLFQKYWGSLAASSSRPYRPQRNNAALAVQSAYALHRFGSSSQLLLNFAVPLAVTGTHNL